MPTLTVRSPDPLVYEGLKALASSHGDSMEAEAHEILKQGVQRQQRWIGAKPADLASPDDLIDLEFPYVRSADLPRDIEG